MSPPRSAAVTVVIPTRNRLQLLQRTLRTVLAQEDVDLSVVIVDEGSSDGTPAYLQAIEDPRIRSLRHDEPKGVSTARNAGVALATTEWVAFVDDDDLWGPTKLAAQLRAIDDDGEARWACVGSVVVDPDLHIVRMSHPPQDRDAGGHLLCFNHIPGGGSGVLVDRELLGDVGGFDAGLSTLADWDLWIRLGLRSPLAMVDAPLLAYVEHGGMSRGARDIERELHVIDDRYADEREAHGRTFDWGWWFRWLGELDERSGRKGSAVRHHVRAARTGDRRAVRDLGRALLGPRAMAREDRRQTDQVSDAWRGDAEGWLAPLRAGEASAGREHVGE